MAEWVATELRACLVCSNLCKSVPRIMFSIESAWCFTSIKVSGPEGSLRHAAGSGLWIADPVKPEVNYALPVVKNFIVSSMWLQTLDPLFVHLIGVVFVFALSILQTMSTVSLVHLFLSLKRRTKTCLRFNQKLIRQSVSCSPKKFDQHRDFVIWQIIH